MYEKRIQGIILVKNQIKQDDLEINAEQQWFEKNGKNH